MDFGKLFIDTNEQKYSVFRSDKILCVEKYKDIRKARSINTHALQ